MSGEQVAWLLAEELGDRLREPERAAIYCALGSGDTYRAVAVMMELATSTNVPVAPNVVTQLHIWLDGYRATGIEPRMRGLINTLETE